MRRGHVSSNKVEIGARTISVSPSVSRQRRVDPRIQRRPRASSSTSATRSSQLTAGRRRRSPSRLGRRAVDRGRPAGSGRRAVGAEAVHGQYEVDAGLDSPRAKPLADDVDALVVAGPKQPLADRAKFVIDQFLMKGKSVAFFVDGMIVESAAQHADSGQDSATANRTQERHRPRRSPRGYGSSCTTTCPRAAAERARPGHGRAAEQLGTIRSSSPPPDLARRARCSVTCGADLPVPLLNRAGQGQAAGPHLHRARFVEPDSWRQSGFFAFNPDERRSSRPTTTGRSPSATAPRASSSRPTPASPYPNEKGEKVGSRTWRALPATRSP